ncbi:MAG: calcium/sodium antiporter [Anaerolineales bacterium]
MDQNFFLQLVGGFGLLILGAELLVRGASKLAYTIGISPLVVGLTFVALGSSTPELAVAFQSSLSGSGDIGVGNIIGSNIINVLFILGITAIILPVAIKQQLVRLDVPIMIAVSVLLFMFSLDGRLGRVDGFILFSGLVVYTLFAIRQSRSESKYVKDEYAQEFGNEECRNLPQALLQVVFVITGFCLLAFGSDWLVEGARSLALALGLSELIIGLTVVALGTGMPEVVTSITASIRGEQDIAVGNIIGSNIYNILAVLGIVSLITPEGVIVPPSILAFDLPIMITVAVACLPIFFLNYRIARWEGALFFGYYLAYTLYLILEATEHDALSTFSFVMAAFMLPLTFVTIAVLEFQYLRSQKPT